MTTQTNEQMAHQKAERKVEFRIHLFTYIAVNALLVLLNLTITPGYLWFVWPLSGWGLGLLIHGIRKATSDGSTLKERMIAKEVKKAGLIIAIMFLTATMYAQERASVTGYGGPMVFATTVNGQNGICIGGKGGAVFGENLAFGGLGFGTINAPGFSGDNFADNTQAPLQMTFGAGGVFFEYIIPVADRLQVTIPLNLMAGGIKVYEDNLDHVVESSAFLILEPGISLDINISDSFIPSLFVNYRKAIGSSLVNFGDDKISGLNAGVVFKFGN